jgi:anti-anti-sigma factor
MRIDTSTYEDYAVLTLKGEFDTFYCPRFQQEVEEMVGRGLAHVILNMRLVKFINSTALGAIIKAHKRCKAEGGDLVISKPSPFVKDIVHKLGIDELVKMFDDDDAAQKHMIKALNLRALAADAPVDEEKVLVAFPDETRIRQLGGRNTVVGRMSNVDGQRLQFTWSGSKHGLTRDQSRQMFFKGGAIELKFQVRLFKKGYFDVAAQVSDVADVGDEEIKVTATYTRISDSDREALDQFANDMSFLKQQLPQ